MPRSTTSPPPLPVTVGNVLTAATIFTSTTAPLRLACTVPPTWALLTLRNRCVARPGMAPGAAGVSASCPPIVLGGTPGYPLAARPYPGWNVTASALPLLPAEPPAGAVLSEVKDGRPDAPAVPPPCPTPSSSGDEASAAQLRRAVPDTCPDGPDRPSTVRTAGSRGLVAGSVYCRLTALSRSG